MRFEKAKQKECLSVFGIKPVNPSILLTFGQEFGQKEAFEAG
jgi:hypothetical protein